MLHLTIDAKPADPVMVDKPGLYLMPAFGYHRDPCPAPSLSSSTIHRMLTRSPRHAWTAHPQLNPNFMEYEPSAFMDDGTILHWMILGAGKAPYIIDAADWRSHSTQRHRTYAREDGRVPVLLHRYRQLRRVAAAVRTQLRGWPGAPDGIEEGLAEPTLVWVEDGMWCRCMVDWLPTQITMPPMVDFKFTSRLAAPERFARSFDEMGYAIQAAWYRRGFRAVFGREPGDFVFVICEMEQPYGVSVVRPGGVFLEIGEQKVDEGLRAWRRCLETNLWPGYAREVIDLDAPRYVSSQWEATEWRSHKQRNALSVDRMQRIMAEIGGPIA